MNVSRLQSIVLTISVFMLASMVGPALAQEREYVTGSDVLVGLDGVHVVVAELNNPDATLRGLSQDALLTAIELRLRQSGVRVLSEDERLKTSRGATLYYNLLLLQREDSGFYAFRTDMHLLEFVWLFDGSNRWLRARTWQGMPFVGTIGANRLGDLLDDARNSTDEFLNDYLAANPKSER